MSAGRTTYVLRDGELVEVSRGASRFRGSWQVMPDITPYTSQIDGSTISSRSKHRAHLRAHGCIEVGNEKQPGPPVCQSPPGLKQMIVDLANERLR
jgi:hypothetical protein